MGKATQCNVSFPFPGNGYRLELNLPALVTFSLKAITLAVMPVVHRLSGNHDLFIFCGFALLNR